MSFSLEELCYVTNEDFVTTRQKKPSYQHSLKTLDFCDGEISKLKHFSFFIRNN